jgi:hypothetical protein
MDEMAGAELLKRLAEFEAVDDDALISSGRTLTRVVEVNAIGPYALRVRLEDGRMAEADLEGLAYRSEHFTALRDPAVVAQVEPVHEGAALRFAGDDSLEVGMDLIVALAERQRAMTGSEFATWMRRHGLSDNTAADVLGLARRTVQGYKVARQLPALVAVACRAFDADETLLPALYHPRRPGRRRRSTTAEAA